MLTALAETQSTIEKYPTSSTHRLGRGLRGYLIPFAPHAFVSQCQRMSSTLSSLLAFYHISTDFTPTHGIPGASPLLDSGSFQDMDGVEPRHLTSDFPENLQTLYAQ